MDNEFPIVIATNGGFQHFFGYYDTSPWNCTETRLLCHRVAQDHKTPPRRGQTIEIGWIDPNDGDAVFHPIGRSGAWNFQQGTMLQWRGNSETQIVYNSVVDGEAVGIEHDLESGTSRDLPAPIGALSPDGRLALSLNFGRLGWARPGYGYADVNDQIRDTALAEDDGVFLVDLEAGTKTLIISVAQMAAIDTTPDMSGCMHFVNHVGFNPSGDRICFIHIYLLPNGDVRSRLMTAGLDGSGLKLLIRGMASHFTWLSDTRLLCWAGERKLLDSGAQKKAFSLKQFIPVGLLKRAYAALGKPRWLMYRLVSDRYFIFDVENGGRTVLGENLLMQDGHCTVSPNGEWVCVDTYPTGPKRELKLDLFNFISGKLHHVARMTSPADLDGELRCDLHPRWSPSGRHLCIDSAHDGLRQLYVLDVTAIVDGKRK